MIKHNVIFCKDKKKETGFVYVTIFQKGKKPKRRSTKLKIDRNLYYIHKNDETHRFNQTKAFDYYNLNKKIDEIVGFFSLPVEETDFINYFKKNIDKQLNGGTKSNYYAIYNRLNIEYPNGLPITEINNNWLKDYKNILYNKYKCSPGYIKGIMLVLISCCKAINSDVKFHGKYSIHFDVNSLKLKTNKTLAINLLSDDDVSTLLNYPNNESKESNRSRRYFEYISFGLCQLFSRGSRFSDLLFLRYNNFKNDGIVIQLPKTEDFKKIPYSLMLLRTLYKYIYREESALNTTELGHIDESTSDVEKIELLKTRVLAFVREQRQYDFFFSFVPEELIYYDPARAFTDDEFKIFATTRGKYNGYLRRISEYLNLDFELTSHAFRYKFVSNCREENIGIYDISKMLCHSSVRVTENYIRTHFEDMMELDDLVSRVDRRYL